MSALYGSLVRRYIEEALQDGDRAEALQTIAQLFIDGAASLSKEDFEQILLDVRA